MLIIITLILFILFFLLPFLPGILEIIKKQDAEPLFISMDYIRNPRYFGRSFKRLLHHATAGFTLTPGIRDVRLSKDEKLELANSLDIPSKREINHMLFIMGNLVSGSKARFNKEIFVTGDAVIGPGNVIQALAGQGNVSIAEGVQIQRWLDADENIDIGPDCNLGISISSGNVLFLAQNCNFRRLYGMPVVTGHDYNIVEDNEERPLRLAESFFLRSSFIRRKDIFIPPETILNENIIFPQDVRIGNGSIIKGDIKCYGKIVLEEDVTIQGNIFTDKDIFIGRRAKIGGHIFSQGSIYISEKTVFSEPDRIKSIIGKMSITIEQNVVIYGHISTEGKGKIL